MGLASLLPLRQWFSRVIYHVAYPLFIKPHLKQVFDIVMFTDGIIWRIDGTVKINKMLYGYFLNEETKKYEAKPVKGVFLVACGSSGLQKEFIYKR